MRTPLTACLAGALFAAAAPPQVGSPMPSLAVHKAYNFDAFKLRNLDQLRGCAILLDYWQTW